MKHKIIALTAAFGLALLCGCGKNDTHTGFDTGLESGSPPDSESSTGGTESKPPVFADFVGEYPEHPLTFLTNENEIRALIEAQPNFKCSEKLYINIPESASIYEYSTYGVRVPQFIYPSSQFINDFEALFEYMFPDREIGMDFFKYRTYLGYDKEKGDYIEENGYVKDLTALSDVTDLIYDEMPERTETWNSPVYIYLSVEIGGGNGVINKGEATYLAGKAENDIDGWKPSDTYNKVSYFEPGMLFESIGIYSPQSEKSFKLLDGEIRICDAVEFVENYLNNIPISAGLQRNMCTRVYNVEVMKINDNTYGYLFHTEPQFQGVNYDPVILGSHSSYNYDPSGGVAFMVKSRDVDYIDGINGNNWTFDVSVCKDIVPVDTAIKTVSEKLSQSVTFEVISVELVYVRQLDKTEEGYINIDTYEARNTPAWRITAGNPNDDRTYFCYIDATDGGNFRYYSAPEITRYDD